MNILTYRFPDEALSADGLTALKAACDGRALVLFQNMPATLESEFPGGTFTAGSEATHGNYTVSMEENVMDRSDWSVTAMTDGSDTFVAQFISIWGKHFVHIDAPTGSATGLVEANLTWATGTAKMVAMVGHVDRNVTDATNSLTAENKINIDLDEKTTSVAATAYLMDGYTLSDVAIHPAFGRPEEHGDFLAVDFMMDV